ncbi:hypothetical protein TNCV_2138631 [Trichonephila clavipes]|nr:hypothetical protein TNCV_2138631 [Trichonephila clavipes]
MLDHLEDNIHRVIADIRPQMLEKVIENWTSRLDYIRASRGSPITEIIFTMYLGGHAIEIPLPRSRGSFSHFENRVWWCRSTYVADLSSINLATTCALL